MKRSAATLLNFGIAGASVNTSGTNFIITVNVVIQNPSNQNLQINSVFGSLYLNNSNIGTVSSFVRVLVAANSQVIYPINISIGLLGLDAAVINILESGLSGINLAMTGTVNVDGITVPLNIAQKIV